MTQQAFIIEPHFRLQEWVAAASGYFRDERARLASRS